MKALIPTHVLGLAVLLPALASATSVAVAPPGYYASTVSLVDGSGATYGPVIPDSSTPPASISASNGTYPESGSLTFNVLGSNPSIFSSATTGAGGGGGCTGGCANIQGIIYYYFSIIAPNGTTPATSVPVILSGQDTLSSAVVPNYGINDQTSADNAFVNASLISPTSGTTSYAPVVCQNNDSGCGSFSYRISGTVSALTAASAGYSGEVAMEAGTQSAGTSTASAYIDPYISIDPSFLAANPGYTIVVSDGFSNVAPSASTVPEPTTVSLAGASLIALFGLWRMWHTKALSTR